MGKLIGICALVAAIWFAAEIATKGTEQAFGGVFASGTPQASAEAPRQSIPKRAGAKVEQAQADAAARQERMLGE